MRSINTSYAGYFNWRHKRSGYLFQGRYKAFPVQDDDHLVGVLRYVERNALRAELVARLKTSGGRSVLDQVDVDRLTEILTGKAAPPS